MTNVDKLLEFKEQKVWDNDEKHEFNKVVDNLTNVDLKVFRLKVKEKSLDYLYSTRIYFKEYFYNLLEEDNISYDKFVLVHEFLTVILDNAILKEDNDMVGNLAKTYLTYEKDLLMFTCDKFLLKKDKSLNQDEYLEGLDSILTLEALTLEKRDIELENIKMNTLGVNNDIRSFEEKKESLEKINYFKNKCAIIAEQEKKQVL